MPDAIMGFWVPASLMGLGIGFDVAIATVARFRSPTLSWKNWTLPITATHVALPALGYYSWWFFGNLAPLLLLPLGVAAAALVAVFLAEAFADWTGTEPLVSMPEFFPEADRAGAISWVAVMAVSMDALFSGPAKAAVANTYAWTQMEVLVSFLVAGVVVAMVAQIALFVARGLRSVRFTDNGVLAAWFVFGQWLEASVIGGFGVLSLWAAMAVFTGPANMWLSMLISGLVFAVLFAFWISPMMREANDSIEDD